MNIVYRTSNVYAPYCGVSMYSLLHNNQEIEDINIYILSDCVLEENKNKLRKTANVFNRKIEFIEVKEEVENIIKKYELPYFKSSIITYANLFLENWFSELDRLITIDSDIIINGSLQSLENIDFGTNVIAGVFDTLMQKVPNPDQVFLNNNTYINAGFMVIDMKSWKKNNITSKIINAMKFENTRFVDQSLINVACLNKVLLLEPKFNFMDHTTRRDKILNVFDTKIYSEKEILYAYDKPVVIHYGGSIFARPWIKDSNSRFKEIYLNYEKISEWKDIEHVYSHQSIQFNRKYPLEKQLKKIYCLVSKSNNSIINSCWNFLAKVTKKLREKI